MFLDKRVVQEGQERSGVKERDGRSKKIGAASVINLPDAAPFSWETLSHFFLSPTPELYRLP